MANYSIRNRERKQKKLETQERIGDTRFVAVPYNVLSSEEFYTLSPPARLLIFEFLYQYNSVNNGDLQASYNVLKFRGWKSPTTLNKAIKELEETKFIIRTRQGGRGGQCNLYALTFYAINECRDKNGMRKIGERETRIPLGYWRKK